MARLVSYLVREQDDGTRWVVRSLCGEGLSAGNGWGKEWVFGWGKSLFFFFFVSLAFSLARERDDVL